MEGVGLSEERREKPGVDVRDGGFREFILALC